MGRQRESEANSFIPPDRGMRTAAMMMMMINPLKSCVRLNVYEEGSRSEGDERGEAAWRC